MGGRRRGRVPAHLEAVLRVNVAVFCPGEVVERPLGYDLAIGVNRAVRWVHCDVWCFCDAETYRENIDLTDLPPVLFLPRYAYEQRSRSLCVRGSMDRHIVRLWEEPQLWPDRATTAWSHLSVTAAMVLAHNLGADRVDVYGAPMSGVADGDGHTMERNNRTEKRWRTERGLVARIARLLKTRGTRVYRVKPNGPA